MKRSDDVSLISRRGFFKTLPAQFVNGLRTLTRNVFENGKEISLSRIARLDIAKCLAWEGLNCQLCYLACPLRDRAIVMTDNRPLIVASECDGCILCEVACRTVNDVGAIETVSRSDGHHR